MSYNYQRISVRPDLGVEFFQASQTTEDYIQTTYKDTGIFVSKDVTYQDGGLIQTMACVFLTQPDWVDFVADPIVAAMIDDRKVYETANGIFSERVEG
jgi:hypothetical protein